MILAVSEYSFYSWLKINKLTLNLLEFTTMSKKYIQMALALAIIGLIGANQSYAQDQRTEGKAMQTRTYPIPEDLKKEMIENIKKNRAEEEAEQSTTPKKSKPEIKSVEKEGTSDKGSKKAPSAEERVWKKYKGLASGLEEEQPSEEFEEETQENDETQTSQEDSGAGDVSSILQNYKSRNDAQMQTRSFSIPEAIEKDNDEVPVDAPSENEEEQEDADRETVKVEKEKLVIAKKTKKAKPKSRTQLKIKTND